jgi:hypothetical protein
MSDVTETDFARIAAELRLASMEAQREADLNPGLLDLQQKARRLARAAARIQEDARAREGVLVIDHEADG